MNKNENMPQKEAKTQDESQNKPKESFIGTGNGSSLRSRTSTWFECKVRYQKTQEDGSEKLVNELYVVDALSFTEAEASIIDNMAVYVSGELRVANINRTNYNEIFFSDIDEVMGKTIIDYELKSLSETKIMDVFEHDMPTKS